jgi:hypothetical protein
MIGGSFQPRHRSLDCRKHERNCENRVCDSHCVGFNTRRVRLFGVLQLAEGWGPGSPEEFPTADAEPVIGSPVERGVPPHPIDELDVCEIIPGIGTPMRTNERPERRMARVPQGELEPGAVGRWGAEKLV